MPSTYTTRRPPGVTTTVLTYVPATAPAAPLVSNGASVNVTVYVPGVSNKCAAIGPGYARPRSTVAPAAYRVGSGTTQESPKSQERARSHTPRGSAYIGQALTCTAVPAGTIVDSTSNVAGGGTVTLAAAYPVTPIVADTPVPTPAAASAWPIAVAAAAGRVFNDKVGVGVMRIRVEKTRRKSANDRDRGDRPGQRNSFVSPARLFDASLIKRT